MKSRLLYWVSGLLIFAVAACTATTTLTTVWKDPNLQPGAIKKMMVVGMAKEPAQRQLFEDEFARRLADHGMSVVKSYEVMTLAQLNDKKGSAEEIRNMGVDAVLATRLIDKEMVDTYHPPTYHYDAPTGFYGGWAGYYGMGYSYMETPGYTVSREVAKLETNIYDIRTEKLVWSALSDTWIEKASENRLMSDFIGVEVDRMTQDGIIPAEGRK